MSYRMEQLAAEGTRRRMGHFSWFFFFLCSLVQISVETEVESRSEQATAVQLFEKSWAAQCFVLPLGVKNAPYLSKANPVCLFETLQVLALCLVLAGPECISINLSLLVSEEKLKCLPCGSPWFLIVVEDFFFFFLNFYGKHEYSTSASQEAEMYATSPNQTFSMRKG